MLPNQDLLHCMSDEILCFPLILSGLQNDVSDILDLTFSMDADEEKHILYGKMEVIPNSHVLSY